MIHIIHYLSFHIYFFSTHFTSSSPKKTARFVGCLIKCLVRFAVALGEGRERQSAVESHQREILTQRVQ